MNRILIWFGRVAVVLGLLAMARIGHAGPAMDPRAMSGIPRIDQQIPAGTVTVRCLLGAFDKPAVGVTVELAVTSADGATTETKTATTVAQGRATFAGLDAFVSGKAIAKATLDGQEVRSQSIPLSPVAGTAVLLVSGAGGGGPPPGAAPPGSPQPGHPMDLTDRPAGTLVVGALDLEARAGIQGIEIKVIATGPDGAAQTITGTTDNLGRATFDNLVPPTIPEGAKLVIEAALGQGEPAQRSVEFEMGTVGKAVVLTRGGQGLAPPTQPQRPQRRPPVLGPRPTGDVPPGKVMVRVFQWRDGQDFPAAAGQPVQVIKKTANGADESFDGVTDERGIAVIEPDYDEAAFYFAGVVFGGGPYQSSFFQIDEHSGAAVDVRVFETTDDLNRVRSALHYEITGMENDNARVIQVYEVLVDGDAAYWPASGSLQILGADGAQHLTILRPSQPWLEEREKAPFAELAGPIPPGEPIHLSVGYTLEHDGDVDINWVPPFSVFKASVMIPDEFNLEGVKATKSDRKAPVPDVTLFDIGENLPAGTPVTFEVQGLPTSDPVYRWIGMALGVAMGLAVFIGIVAQPGGPARQRLMARRKDLLGLLERLERDGGDPGQRDRVLAALDRIYRQLAAVDRVRAGAKAGSKPKSKPKSKAGKSSNAE